MPSEESRDLGRARGRGTHVVDRTLGRNSEMLLTTLSASASPNLSLTWLMRRRYARPWRVASAYASFEPDCTCAGLERQLRVGRPTRKQREDAQQTRADPSRAPGPSAPRARSALARPAEAPRSARAPGPCPCRRARRKAGATSTASRRPTAGSCTTPAAGRSAAADDVGVGLGPGTAGPSRTASATTSASARATLRRPAGARATGRAGSCSRQTTTRARRSRRGRCR